MMQIHADPDLDLQHWRKEEHGARKELQDRGTRDRRRRGNSGKDKDHRIEKHCTENRRLKKEYEGAGNQGPKGNQKIDK